MPVEKSDVDVIAQWPRSMEEVRWWAGESMGWPVTPEAIGAWAREADDRAFILGHDGLAAAYGELWLNREENEVELARLIVRPELRGLGVGRRLVSALVGEARSAGFSNIFLRVVAQNHAARACYTGAGFSEVSAQEAGEFNQGQPLEYVWMRFDGASGAKGAETAR